VEYAGTLLDITERRELETQLSQVRKMDAIGQLTGGIAHDFNNLLAAVLGGLGMIERRAMLGVEEKRIVAMTRHAAEQGAELVKHLLAFSRRQKLDPAAIDIDQLAISVTNLMTHTLGGRVELAWEQEPDLPCVYADAAQLELALMNLIINARDAMPRGGAVTVRAAKSKVTETREGGLRPGYYVVLAVVDNGNGIAPELIEQVIEPFFTTKPLGKGTGLGLSMVYGFAKQSGGAVRVESEIGRGTAVEIWLPAAEAARHMEQEGPKRARKRKSSSRSLKVLLVDDHDGVRATTAALLQDLGHHVVETAEGRQALDLLRAMPHDFDIVLSDYAMPRVSGIDLIRELREIRPGLPAIIITGYAEPDLSVRAYPDVPVLTKPIDAEELQNSLLKAAARA